MEWSYIWIIGLILSGFLLLAIELLVCPGTTVVGIAGFAAIAFGVYSCFAQWGSIGGMIGLSATILSASFLLIYIVRAKTWKKISLSEELKGKSSVNVGIENLGLSVGTEGVCVSRLAPMGMVNFKDRYVEVRSSVRLINTGTKVRIIKIDGAEIYVEEVFTSTVSDQKS